MVIDHGGTEGRREEREVLEWQTLGHALFSSATPVVFLSLLSDTNRSFEVAEALD